MASSKLSFRSHDPEWMDQLSIQDNRLTDALADLRLINRLLGGYSTSFSALDPFMTRQAGGAVVKVIDIGCGGGDFAEAFLRRTSRKFPRLDLRIAGIDNSPATVAWAQARLAGSLPPMLLSKAEFVCGNAFQLPFADKSFDIAHASLFLHHFSPDSIILLLREMRRVSTNGIVVNDLHRHAVALTSITCLTRLLKASAMVQHDGPLSVRRAFTRDELARIGAAAGLERPKLSWHWAFRWLLTTVGC